MSKISDKNKKRLFEYTAAKEHMPIRCLPVGFYSEVLSITPCIFIGPKNYALWLSKGEITIAILEKILNKATRDKNKKAVVALLRYAAHNKKRFWLRYKATPLGLKVMAEILGKNE